MTVVELPPGRPDPISMQDVTKMFGPVGVQHMSLSVPEGSIMGLVGPSGCGKTTTVRLLLGVYRQDSGVMAVLGEESAQLTRRTRAKIGYMPQHYVLSPRMTVWETMEFVASLYGMAWFRRWKRIREALEFVELDDSRHKIVANLSGGMQRRLALASMLAPDPTLIFADEPTAGIDPVLVGRLRVDPSQPRTLTDIEQGWTESVLKSPTQIFLEKCGGWEDTRTPEEIVAEIYAARTISDRAVDADVRFAHGQLRLGEIQLGITDELPEFLIGGRPAAAPLHLAKQIPAAGRRGIEYFWAQQQQCANQDQAGRKAESPQTDLQYIREQKSDAEQEQECPDKRLTTILHARLLSHFT